MTETCIVCLGDLVPQDEGLCTAADAAIANDDGADSAPQLSKLQQVVAPPPPEPAPKEEEMVAHLQPCGHDLHNECLKPWVERANSCPICRANFNMVELRARPGAITISSYTVKDKQQVADIDPSMIIDEDDDDNILEDSSYEACMVCDEFGDSTQLMFCHSCDQLCHVFCAGLDDMPSRGAWYCQGCMENPTLLQTATRRPSPRGPAAYVNGRSRVPHRHRAPDEWVGVWQSVWNRLHFDIEFPFEEEEQQSETRSEIARREEQEWNTRFELARRMGAGTRFRAAADNIHSSRLHAGDRVRPTQVNKTLHRDPSKSPDPESQEELRAWNAFEKAREQVAETEGLQPLNDPNASGSRRRKRKSAESSPAEPELEEPQPERKLKRPRTRLNVDTSGGGGESSASAARRNTLTLNQSPPPNGASTGESSAAPGFLQSILQEVAVDRFAEQEREIAAPQPKRVIIDRACSPLNSSPGLSPVYMTPRPGMTTPPPLNINRTDSPAGSNGPHSPTYSPYSPAEDDSRMGRKKLVFRQNPAAGLTSPPCSKDSSPTRSSLSYSTKAELQRMVTAVLKPLYNKKEITKDVYTEVNRDVSRLLYERVGDAGADALANQTNREKWQKMANDEIDMAVKSRNSNSNRIASSPPPAATGLAEDSASSSSS